LVAELAMVGAAEEVEPEIAEDPSVVVVVVVEVAGE
jgi:hypothetical protein